MALSNTVLDNVNNALNKYAGNNSDPVNSVDDVRGKYAKYFETDDNSIVSVDTFFQLLMAEMTNQDPLEPTSNTEFVSQLASFTALQTNEDSLYYNTVSYAASMAGKTVTVSERDGTDENGKLKMKLVTGVVTGVDISDDKNVEVTINGKRYPITNVMNVASNASGSIVSSTDGAYAVSLIGKNVLLQAENSEGQTIIESGLVDSIEVENGVYRIVVGNYSYPLDSVIRVSNPAASTGGSGNTGSTDGDTNAEDTARAAALAETRPIESASQADVSESEDKVQAAENNGLMDMILYS